MFYRRLEELRKYRGATKRRLAVLFGLTEQHIGSLLNRGHDPAFSVVVGYARRLMLSLDWLAGYDVPMWSTAITKPYIKEALTKIGECRNYGERTRAIIRALHEVDSAHFDTNLIALLLRSEMKFAEFVLEGSEEVVKLQYAQELVNIFGLSHEWMHTGEGSAI